MRQLVDTICKDKIKPSVGPREVNIEFLNIVSSYGVVETELKIIKISVTPSDVARQYECQYSLRCSMQSYSRGVYVRTRDTADHVVLVSHNT